MKKKYVKPTMKLVEWNFQNPICNTVMQHSPCIHVIGTDSGQTHAEHRGTWTEEDIHWNNW